MNKMIIVKFVSYSFAMAGRPARRAANLNPIEALRRE